MKTTEDKNSVPVAVWQVIADLFNKAVERAGHEKCWLQVEPYSYSARVRRVHDGSWCMRTLYKGDCIELVSSARATRKGVMLAFHKLNAGEGAGVEVELVGEVNLAQASFFLTGFDEFFEKSVGLPVQQLLEDVFNQYKASGGRVSEKNKTPAAKKARDDERELRAFMEEESYVAF